MVAAPDFWDIGLFADVNLIPGFSTGIGLGTAGLFVFQFNAGAQFRF